MKRFISRIVQFLLLLISLNSYSQDLANSPHRVMLDYNAPWSSILALEDSQGWSWDMVVSNSFGLKEFNSIRADCFYTMNNLQAGLSNDHRTGLMRSRNALNAYFGIRINELIQLHSGLGFEQSTHYKKVISKAWFSIHLQPSSTLSLSQQFVRTSGQRVKEYIWKRDILRTNLNYVIGQNASVGLECLYSNNAWSLSTLTSLMHRNSLYKISFGILPSHFAFSITKRYSVINLEIIIGLHQELGPSPSLVIIHG